MGREVAIDASDMPADANGQRFLYNHDPERQSYSDPTPPRGTLGPLHAQGRRLLRPQDSTPLVRHYRPAARLGSRDRTPQRVVYVAPLLDPVRARGFQPETVAMDGGYDNNCVYGECHERGIAPVIPLRKGRIQPETPIKRGTPEWATLYRRRTSVEREFGRLKHEYGLGFLRVRGIERFRLHADLVMLGRLSLALARSRAVPLAA